MWTALCAPQKHVTSMSIPCKGAMEGSQLDVCKNSKVYVLITSENYILPGVTF